eukprot:343245-Chlamydomonas_euryale.AAC.1
MHASVHPCVHERPFAWRVGSRTHGAFERPLLFGASLAQECLEDNMDQAKFSPQCKEELDGILASRVADFRLDTALRDACETDVEVGGAGCRGGGVCGGLMRVVGR